MATAEQSVHRDVFKSKYFAANEDDDEEEILLGKKVGKV